MFRCSSCQEFVAWGKVGCQQNEYYKCKSCKRYDIRVAKGLQAATPESHAAWQKKSKEERQHFKAIVLADSRINQETFNVKLATATLTSEASTRNRSSNNTSGNYLDSPDLAKKYEGKPEQLQNVRERTDNNTCRTRGVN